MSQRRQCQSEVDRNRRFPHPAFTAGHGQNTPHTRNIRSLSHGLVARLAALVRLSDLGGEGVDMDMRDLG